jgi:hypothetical protein
MAQPMATGWLEQTALSRQNALDCLNDFNVLND